MTGPFYNAIKGTTAGAPGTGAFTPNAASAGYRAWSTVPTGWIGLVRFEDGSNWELCYSYWGGTTLSRSATQDIASSTGSPLTLTSAATASLIADGARISPSLNVPVRGVFPIPGATTVPTALGCPAPVVTGTAGAGTIAATTNPLTEIPRVHIASATTANAQCGYTHSVPWALTKNVAGRGGWAFNCRFGATTVPTGPRLAVGMRASTFVGNTGEPSAHVANYACVGVDSTDTNLQLMTSDGTGAATKIDTGIPFVINALYEVNIWTDPGSLTVKCLVIRIDTGAIFYTETSTDVPPTGSAMFPQFIGGLSATTGTALTLIFGGYTVRTGGW